MHLNCIDFSNFLEVRIDLLDSVCFNDGHESYSCFLVSEAIITSFNDHQLATTTQTWSRQEAGTCIRDRVSGHVVSIATFNEQLSGCYLARQFS